jgi:hypothetical protein
VSAQPNHLTGFDSIADLHSRTAQLELSTDGHFTGAMLNENGVANR